MNLTIKPGAALDDAQQIEAIIEKINQSMQELNNVIDRTIPSGIETEWSEKFQNDWKNYYSGDIPEAMASMQLSAKNLKMAVDQALSYSKGE